VTKFRIEGLKELDAGLGELKKATGLNVLRRVSVARLEPMRQDAEDLAPVLSGRLEAAETVSTKKPRTRRYKKESTVEAFMGPRADDPFAVTKGIQQEFGNANHGPQPFMTPAFEANKAGALAGVAHDLGDEIEKARSRAARKQARLIAAAGG
jgi:hypothetical protein